MHWIYGKHAVVNALGNKQRRHTQLLMIEKYKKIPEIQSLNCDTKIIITDKQKIENLFPQANHQGIALETSKLPTITLQEVAEQAPEKCLILILDQISDPHNLGAIIRSAATFKIYCIIIHNMYEKNLINPIMTKIASGGMEYLHIISVSNIVGAMNLLKKQNFWCLGLTEQGQQTINQYNLNEKVAMVIGSEGEGLRKLVLKTCDTLINIPTQNNFGTLNASNAAAIGCYEHYRQNIVKKN